MLISDSVDVSCRNILQEAGVAVDYKPGLSKEDLLAIIKVSLGPHSMVFVLKLWSQVGEK